MKRFRQRSRQSVWLLRLACGMGVSSVMGVGADAVCEVRLVGRFGAA